MKWLLITTATRTKDVLGSNVGDEFALLGIQRAIREVDEKPEFDRLNKQDNKAWNPRPFDKAVVCGMPLFSSLPCSDYPGYQSCQSIWWWPRIIRGWPSAVRENFLVWGVGHVFVDRIVSLLDYVSAIEETINRSYRLIVREPVLDHPRVIDSVCPSAFCLLGYKGSREVPCCNLMPTGGHFGYLTPDGEAWTKTVKAVSEELRKRKFQFIAHDRHEAAFAKDLGWHGSQVHLFNSAQEYLDIYDKASCYFGNRLHGAAVCASRGIPTWGASHDSRLGMVRRLGGRATRTPEATPKAVADWAEDPVRCRPTPTEYTPAGEYNRMLPMLRGFMRELAKPPWTD